MSAAADVTAEVIKTASGDAIRDGVWTGVVIAAITLLTVIVQKWGPWKIINGNQHRATVATMGERIAKLEERLDQQTLAYEAKLDQERAQHSAELQVMRHRMNNLDQCLTMLLALIELDPDKARASAARVREMRERQEANEAAEKSAIAAARIAPAAVPAPTA